MPASFRRVRAGATAPIRRARAAVTTRRARRPPRTPSAPRARRWPPTSTLAVLVVAVGAGLFLLLDRPAADAEVRTAGPPVPSLSPWSQPPLSLEPSPTPSPAAPATSSAPVLTLPGPVPAAGRGTFGYDDQPGVVLGRAGVLQRYRVAVEAGAGEDAHAFAAQVQTALAGPGSWVDSGRLRLRQVPGTSAADFTVYLATARTAARMCASGGVDIRVGGRPYTSCRATGKVIINLDRWRTSVPHFVRAGVPLSVYRTYVVNHEVGHQLGYHHESCPGAGRPAPVMQQQTLFLHGCVPNPWPYLDGRRYAGPLL
jgi:hypothetical protein